MNEDLQNKLQPYQLHECRIKVRSIEVDPNRKDAEEIKSYLLKSVILLNLLGEKHAVNTLRNRYAMEGVPDKVI